MTTFIHLTGMQACWHETLGNMCKIYFGSVRKSRTATNTTDSNTTQTVRSDKDNGGLETSQGAQDGLKLKPTVHSLTEDGANTTKTIAAPSVTTGPLTSVTAVTAISPAGDTMANATDMTTTYTTGITGTDEADTGEKAAAIHLGATETVTTDRCSSRAKKTP